MIGQYIQNYKIVSLLGEGGMGTVYRATDTVLGRDVALKMLNSTLTNQPQFLERFKKEARILAQLLHPNIAVIYNFIEQDSNYYMVMEYVEGENFDSLLRRNKVLSYGIVIPLFIQALEGLQHAHKKGIFHRDIKPSNLNLTPDGTVKLMDFGIAKIANEQRLTQVNRIVGTIEYMAPELIEGKDPSIACDIYAIGVTMYEMLCGKLPFESNTDFNMMQDILKKKPATIDTINASVPKSLSNITMKALEKKPENRFPDARSFQQALITAFPQLKTIDMASINLPKKILETQFVQLNTVENNELKATVMMNAQDQTSIAQPSLIQGWFQNMLSKQARPLLLTVVALIIMITITAIVFSGGSDKKQMTAADTSLQPGKKPKDTSAENIPQLQSSLNNTPVNAPEVRTPVTPVTNIPVPENETTEEPKKKEKIAVVAMPKKEVRKNKPNVTTETNRKKADPAPGKTEEKKIVAPVETKTHVPKRIEIKSRVSVEIKLQDRVVLDNLSEGQTLHFIVTRPVDYEGETIIKRGAPVNVTIKGIGRVFIALTVNNVESASGQKIYLNRVGLTKKKKDLPDGETYSINLGKGIIVEL
jgi:serine/threonine protein kinase